MTYDIHHFLTAVTNVRHLFPDYFAVAEPSPSLPRLSVRVTPAVQERLEGRRIAVSYAYSDDDDALLFTSAWSRRARISMSGLSSDRIEISATPRFHRLSRLGWQPYALQSLVRAVLAALLLRMRKTLTFTACVGFEDQGVLLPAYYGVAKTLTALSLVLRHGGQYLSDEFTILSDSNGYGFPASCQLSLPMAQQLGITLDFLRRIGLSARLLGAKALSAVVVSSKASVPLEYLMPPSAIRTNTKLTHVLFLQPGPEEIVDLDREEALRTLMHINRYEIGFGYHPVLQIYDYFNARFGLAGLMSQEERSISRLIDSAEKCSLVISPSATRAAEIIAKMLAPATVSFPRSRLLD
jgi:hypothetical protein